MAVYYNRVYKIFVEVNENEENKEILDYYGFDPVSSLIIKERYSDPRYTLKCLVIPYQTDSGNVFENKIVDLITELDITNGFGTPETWSEHKWVVYRDLKKVNTIKEISDYLDDLRFIINRGKPTTEINNDGNRRLINVEGETLRATSRDSSRYNPNEQIFTYFESKFKTSLKEVFLESSNYPLFQNNQHGNAEETKVLSIPSYNIDYRKLSYTNLWEEYISHNPYQVNITFIPYISPMILFYLRKKDPHNELSSFGVTKCEYDKLIEELEQLNNLEGQYHLNLQYQLYDAKGKDLDTFLKGILKNTKKPKIRNKTYRTRDYNG